MLVMYMPTRTVSGLAALAESWAFVQLKHANRPKNRMNRFMVIA